MKKASFDIILGKKFKYKKRVKTTFVRLSVPAQLAKPTPPLGPTIGQYGLNIAEVCSKFNQATLDYEEGTIIPILLMVTNKKTYTFEVKKPGFFPLLCKVLRIEGGYASPREAKKKIKRYRLLSALYIIARIQVGNLPNIHKDSPILLSLVKQYLATVKSIGIICALLIIIFSFSPYSRFNGNSSFLRTAIIIPLSKNTVLIKRRPGFFLLKRNVGGDGCKEVITVVRNKLCSSNDMNCKLAKITLLNNCRRREKEKLKRMEEDNKKSFPQNNHNNDSSSSLKNLPHLHQRLYILIKNLLRRNFKK